MRLAEGRTLGYRELGDPAGYPVFYFHGVPGVRQGLVGRPADYERAGIRLITVDRPGYGRSTPRPSASVADWPADVHQLATGLGIGRYAVIGESGGAPYALACADQLAGELSSVVISSGIAPFQARRARTGMKPLNRVGLHLLRHRGIARPGLTVLTILFRRWPDFVLDQVLCRQNPPADDVLLHRPQIRAAAKAMLARTIESGVEGIIDDVDRISRSWGFDPARIEMPVHFWHGDADNTAPVRHLLELAAGMHRATVVVWPDEGHMVMEAHLDEVLDLVLRRAAAEVAPEVVARGA